MYADTVTPSMKAAMEETERRRAKQDEFNRAHGITPRTIVKGVRDVIEISRDPAMQRSQDEAKHMTLREREEAIRRLEKEMAKASRMLEFEYAAVLRDRIIELRSEK